MKPKRDIASFVLRFTQDIWQDDNGEPRVEWRGHVRHVQDGKELHFKDVAEAVHFFQDVLLHRTNECMKQAEEGERQKVVAESKKLWMRFADTYGERLAEAVQQTQRQVNDAFDSALRPVRWVTGLVSGREDANPTNENERLVEAIRSLEEQLQTLNAKLNNTSTTITTAISATATSVTPSSPTDKPIPIVSHTLSEPRASTSP